MTESTNPSEKELVSYAQIKKMGKHRVEEVLLSPERDRVYLVTDRDDKGMRKILKVDTTDTEKKEEVLVASFGLDGRQFQLDPHDENKVYFLMGKAVYTHVLEKEESGFTSFFSKGLGIMSKEKENEGEENLYGSVEFFRAKADLHFLRFEPDMQHFFCDDGRVIKKYRSDNKEVVAVYDDLLRHSTDLLLHPAKPLFLR